MDTSDSEESDHEWKPEQESERESEQESVIKNRKRNFKVGRRRSSVVMRRSYEENSETPPDDAVKSTSSSDVCCCTCSKNSSCKTMKCQCRATKGSCGPSCGCSSIKCSNRNADGNIYESEALENGENSQESDEKDKDQQQVLASRGATLLQNALADKPGEETNNDDGGTRRRRKPLSDIGNTTGKSNVPKPSQRKKWKKTVLQLVPVGPPAPPTPVASSQEEANPVIVDLEASRKPENSDSGESNSTTLKLPRAMRSASSNGSNLLRERNADQSGGGSVGSSGLVQSNSSRATESRTSDEKENHTRRI